MKESIKSIIEWSEQTFPDATLRGQLNKFKDEFEEWNKLLRYLGDGIGYTGDILELADMFIVACSIARFDMGEAMAAFRVVEEILCGTIYTSKEFEETVDMKMELNRKRKWKKQNGKYQHMEE